MELQNTFARIDEMRDLDPDNFSEASPRQTKNIKGTAPWTRYRLLDLILGAALDAPAAWIATETKLALLTTEAFIGRAIHVDTVLGRITLHGKARSAQEKANDTSEIKKMRER